MMKPITIFIISFMISTVSLSAWAQERPQGELTGEIRDARNQQTLIGVNILLQNTEMGGATDSTGSYRITNIPAGVYAAEVSYIGYEHKTVTDVVIRPGRTTRINITLDQTVIEGEEVAVSAGYFSRNRGNPVSVASFNAEELRRSPGSGQEITRVLNMLPGVASTGDNSQDIRVRGGSPLENGFYIDNIPVPSIQHFRDDGGRTNGPIGIVNTDLVDDVTLYSGGFSTIYGDRLSSISDIRYQTGSRDRLSGDLSFSMAGMGGTLEGPIGSNGSLLVSARRSYLDLVANMINAGGAPRYGDAQAKLELDLGRHSLTVLNIAGSSKFESDRETFLEDGVPYMIRTRHSQNTAGINLRSFWSDKWFSKTSLSHSWMERDFTSRDIDDNSLDSRLVNNDHFITLRNVTTWVPNEWLLGHIGMDLTTEWGNYDYFFQSGYNEAGDLLPEFERDFAVTGSRAGLFGTVTVQPFSMLDITAGVRSDYNSYNETATFDPRLAIRLGLADRLNLNLSAGRFHQLPPRYLYSQSRSNLQLKATRADQYVIGLEYQLTDDTRITLEGYRKYYSDAPRPQLESVNSNPDFVLDTPMGYYPDLGTGARAFAEGVELLLQKKLAQNFYGMVSASVYRTEFKNYEEEYQPRAYDGQYQINLVGGYRPNDTWEVSARWTLLGGRPYTPFDSRRSAEVGEGIRDISRFHQERLPAYHSLFLRFDRRFFFNRTHLVTFIELWNAYDRENLLQYSWDRNENAPAGVQQFTILPVGGLLFEF